MAVLVHRSVVHRALVATITVLAAGSCSRNAPLDPAAAVTESARAALDRSDLARPAIGWSLEIPAAPPPDLRSAIERCPGPPPPLPTHRARAACADPAIREEHVTVLHVSDMHGHWHPYLGRARRPTVAKVDEENEAGAIDERAEATPPAATPPTWHPAPGKGRSPFAVLRAFSERRRQETGGRTLFLDAGDDLEKGAIAELRSDGEATVHLLDYLALDARTLGNHDFAYGVASVLRQSSSRSHDVVASNIRYLPLPSHDPRDGAGDSSAFRAKRTVVYRIGCARIGVFGLVINGYDETDDRIDAPYLGVFEQRHDPGDPDRYVRLATELVKELREQEHVDAVIALDHLGMARDRPLIDGVPGLDLVISGHDHVFLNGFAQGKTGVMVDTGTFIGGRRDARVGELALDIDLLAHTAKLAGASSRRIDDLPDDDATLEAEVRRVQACLAPDADDAVVTLSSPIAAGRPDMWTPVVDAALRRRFPGAAAFLYEAWASNGLLKQDLPAGPLTTQGLADAMFVERERPGVAGFTAFVEVDLPAAALRSICNAPLREPHPGEAMHRVCPPLETLRDGARYRLAIERRPLHAPHLAFLRAPPGFPGARDAVSAPAELFDIVHDYSKASAHWTVDSDAVALVPLGESFALRSEHRAENPSGTTVTLGAPPSALPPTPPALVVHPRSLGDNSLREFPLGFADR